MSRIPRTHRHTRSSLRSIGIPDARDALAIYFRWVRQARYYRAAAVCMDEKSIASPSSVAASTGEAVHTRRLLSSTVVVPVRFNVASLAYDLTCVGAGCHEAETVGFPCELEIVGASTGGGHNGRALRT